MLNISKEKTESETHPLLPSGEWEGFYCYNHSKDQHKMEIELNFIHSMITGSGVDDIAPFTWRGKYDLEKFKLTTHKIYATHQFFYKGDIDENGIWGTWESVLDPNRSPRLFQLKMKGGFHIWPKKAASDAAKNSISEENTSEILQEIFLEEFN